MTSETEAALQEIAKLLKAQYELRLRRDERSLQTMSQFDDMRAKAREKLDEVISKPRIDTDRIREEAERSRSETAEFRRELLGEIRRLNDALDALLARLAGNGGGD